MHISMELYGARIQRTIQTDIQTCRVQYTVAISTAYYATFTITFTIANTTQTCICYLHRRHKSFLVLLPNHPQSHSR
jgi:hypothetical protein